MRLLFVGPLRDFSGWATSSRNILYGLKNAGADIVARNVKYDEGCTYDFDDEHEELFRRPMKDIHAMFQMTTPNEMRVHPGLFNIGMIFCETTSVPQYWAQQLNKFDLIVVPCQANAVALKTSGVIKPIVVSYPMFDNSIYEKEYNRLDIDGVGDEFLFYNICQLTPKKGIDALLKAYLTGFLDVPDKVMLILKMYINMANRQGEQEQIEHFIAQIKRGLRIPEQHLPKVNLITDIFDSDEVQGLHQKCDCYVNSSRADGWNICCFEAMAHGNLVVSNQWGGMQEYVTQNNALLYGGQLAPVFEMFHPDPMLYTATENWFEPNIVEMRAQMRNAFGLSRSGDLQHMNAVSSMTGAAKSITRNFDYKLLGPAFLKMIERGYEVWKEKGTLTEEDLNLQSRTVQL